MRSYFDPMSIPWHCHTTLPWLLGQCALPHLPWPSDRNRNGPICVTLPKETKVGKDVFTLAKIRAITPVTYDCTCLGHLGRRDIDRIIFICIMLPKVVKASKEGGDILHTISLTFSCKNFTYVNET